MLERGPRSGPFSIGATLEAKESHGGAAVTWEPELEELRRREELARRMGGEERVARQHASGRLTVRERIERLFDIPAPSTRPARSPARRPTTATAS